MSILRTKSLAIGYRNRRKKIIIAQNLNLHLQAGEVVCLLGQNGAGKSTLIRTLTGILPALAGEVQIQNQNIHKIIPKKLAQYIALVLTTPITANFSVWELVGTGRYPYTGQFGLFSEYDQRKIKNALSETEMLDFAHRKIGSLSDGERQKVMIARALAQDTPLIILDEPTAHLDLPNRVMIFKLLKKAVKKYKKAVLVSTHELDLALQVADKIWLQTEQTVQTGAPEDLVLDGSFEKIFQKNDLFFEKNTGKFVISYLRKIQIRVAIQGLVGIWTKRAIERIGCQPTDMVDFPKITYDEVAQKWIYQTENVSFFAGSIAELVEFIAQKNNSSKLNLNEL